MAVEYKGLVEFQHEIENLEKDVSRTMENIAKELAEYLIATVTPRTPVYAPKTINGILYEAYDKGGKRKGGNLRERWIKDNKNLVVRHVGNSYVIEVVNDSPYASFVEDGHRQNVGQRFPVYKNGKLSMATHKKAFVQGQHFLRLSEADLRRKAPGIIQQEIDTFLRSIND